MIHSRAKHDRKKSAGGAQRFLRLGLLFPLCAALLTVTPLIAQNQPNILVIFGDDIGMWNISAYHRGMMGGSTPNIDRLADEGAFFTDYYAQQSCTAGRAAFITGQHPFRTGLLTIGMPGAKQGLQSKDPTLAELLKPHGYTSGQFGKNHLGDLDEFLPTSHGFDEFYGNLYHLNAEEEPETYHYPKDEEFHKQFRTSRSDPLVLRWPDRRHRPAEPQAYGDCGRRVSRCLAELHRARRQRRQALLRLAQRHPHARLSPHDAGGRQGGLEVGAGIQRNCEPEKKFFGPEQVHSTGYPQHPRTIARPTQVSTARRAAAACGHFWLEPMAATRLPRRNER